MDIIVGAGSLKDRVSIPLATRQGNHIPNERRPERSPASLNASVEIFKKEHPGAKPRSKTASFDITVVSKWGADAEYIHAIDDLPGLLKGDMIEFWTERR